MDTPVTPQRTRPALGARSHTDTPPKSQGANQGKKYHLDLFNHSQHRHHGLHHTQGKDKASGDKAGLRPNLRRQLQNPVSDLANIITPGDASHKSGQRQSREPFGQGPLAKLPTRTVKPEDVERERQKGRQRDEEVRNALSKLSDTAQSNTRRLDLAYYSLLEKVRLLLSTIANLQELSTASNELREGFRHDSATVEKETQAQIDALDGFGDQQNRVRDLESRVKVGMAKAEKLSTRLEAARKRVETWEAREKEWQAKTSKRLAIGWWCSGVIVTLVVLLLILRRITSPPSTDQIDLGWTKNASLPSFIVEDLADISSRRLAARTSSGTNTPVTLPSDRRLRVFEEL